MSQYQPPWTHILEVLPAGGMPDNYRVVARGPMLEMLSLFPVLVQSGEYAAVRLWDCEWTACEAEFDARGVRENADAGAHL